jgi:hypothetical protein
MHGKCRAGYGGFIKKCGRGSISRVLSLRFSEAVIIPLALTLLPGSSDLPGSFERATLQRSPIWSCSGWGLPCQPCHQGCGELLPRLFTLTPRHDRGGIFSVALSLGSPPVAVSDHPALWSSDFPLALGQRSPDPLPHLKKMSQVPGRRLQVKGRNTRPVTCDLRLFLNLLVNRLVRQPIGPAIFFSRYM